MNDLVSAAFLTMNLEGLKSMPVNSPIYIALNGAPETGKSTVIARGLMERFRSFTFNVHGESFANPLKMFIATSLGVKYNDLKKSTMMGILRGYTPREFVIDLGDNYIKGRYGDDIFGRWLVHRVLRIEPLPDIVIIDDLGYDSEYSVLGHSARLVRITRPGKSFEGDSRSHIDNPHYHLVNDGTLEELELKLDHLANWCIDQLPKERRPPPIED